MLLEEKNLDVLSIPVWVADRLIGHGTEGIVKIYLRLLRMSGAKNRPLTVEDIKSHADINPEVAQAALAFFKENSIIDLDENGAICFNRCIETQAVPRNPLESDRPPVYTSVEISGQIKKNAGLAQMYSLVQCMLGKTLSSAAAATLYSFYDWLGMSPEVITSMVEYCVGLNKKDMRYMEKVAISWHQMGITSVDMAEKYIKSQNGLQKYSYAIKKAFGIYDRNLTAKEDRYILSWHDEFCSSPELAALAFEYCVNQTGKLSFAYINSILERWHKEGIKTVEQAQNRNRPKAEKTQRPAGKKDFQVYNTDQYDFDEIERVAAQKLKLIYKKEGE